MTTKSAMYISRQTTIQKSMIRVIRNGLPKPNIRHVQHWQHTLTYNPEPGFYLDSSVPTYPVSPILIASVTHSKELDGLLRKWFCYNLVCVPVDSNKYKAIVKMIDGEVVSKEYENPNYDKENVMYNYSKYENIRLMITRHLKDRCSKNYSVLSSI